MVMSSDPSANPWGDGSRWPVARGSSERADPPRSVSPRLKHWLIQVACRCRLTALSERVLRMRFATDFVRAVNYHATPRRSAQSLESHFRYLSRRYVSIGVDGLSDVLAGNWRESRPGILISFDDGLRSNYVVAAPLLEKYGLTGWFFLPAGLIEACDDGQVRNEAEFARAHSIRVPPEDASRDEPVFMSWAEARHLAGRHVIGCHTMTHARLHAGHATESFRQETIGAKSLMEARLGRAVDSFCWVGGEEASYSRAAAAWIAQAGYRYAFMTKTHPVTAATDPLQLHRTNLEAGWPLSWVEFYLSGVMDAVRRSSRRRVDRTTSLLSEMNRRRRNPAFLDQT